MYNSEHEPRHILDHTPMSDRFKAWLKKDSHRASCFYLGGSVLTMVCTLVLAMAGFADGTCRPGEIAMNCGQDYKYQFLAYFYLSVAIAASLSMSAMANLQNWASNLPDDSEGNKRARKLHYLALFLLPPTILLAVSLGAFDWF